MSTEWERALEEALDIFRRERCERHRRQVEETYLRERGLLPSLADLMASWWWDSRIGRWWRDRFDRRR